MQLPETIYFIGQFLISFSWQINVGMRDHHNYKQLVWVSRKLHFCNALALIGREDDFNSQSYCFLFKYIRRMSTYSRKEIEEFLLYSLLIYAFYLISGVYNEKLLKHKYLNPRTQASSTFDEPIAFCLFPQLTAAIISYCIGAYQRCKSQTWVVVPWGKSLMCGLIVNFNMWTYNKAVMYASFPAVIMVKSCGLLSVIIVGVFCSRVKQKSLKLSPNKLIIGAVVTVGILLFNYFKVTQKDVNDKPISWISGALLLASLIGDGFLPDFQADIKATVKPGTISLYYYLNRATFMIALAYLVVSGSICYVIQFMWECPEFSYDMLLYSLLNSLGQLAVYKMVNLFKQHIPAFVIATRKCFSVIVSIIIFGHQIVWIQGIGIILVFTAVLMEVYLNYKEKMQAVSVVPEPDASKMINNFQTITDSKAAEIDSSGQQTERSLHSEGNELDSLKVTERGK